MRHQSFYLSQIQGVGSLPFVNSFIFPFGSQNCLCLHVTSDRQTESSDGKPWLICILPFSLGVHAITFDCSTFSKITVCKIKVV